MKTQHSPSLRCQAHWQNAQSQHCNQFLPKSLPALPTPTLGQKDNAAKIKDRITEYKNGQLVTRYIKNWADTTEFQVRSTEPPLLPNPCYGLVKT